MTLNQLVGIGLRSPHYKHVLENKPSIGWFEVHTENFFLKGGVAIETLVKISKNYPISLHGIGLSLGSEEGVDNIHLQQISRLTKLVNPYLISEHLSWGRVDGVYMHDLLPIPYTNESLDVFSKNIDVTQEFLKQEILIENPSSYIEFKSSYLKESDFLVELCKLTGAKILLDVNNIFVSCFNHDWDALGYINSIPKDLVKEIHLSGHSSRIIGSDQVLLVDTHNDYVCQEVWDLYEHAIQRFGPTPTLIEWDKDIPSFDALISEANRASQYLSKNINETTYA